MKNQEFLYEILSQVSVSGNPQKLQYIIKHHMKMHADKVIKDEVGDTICILNPDSPNKILITAHADEIGLVITSITKEGMLTAAARGGIIPHTYPGQQVQVATQKGILYGVVQETRELLKKPDLGASDFLIDIGASSEEEAALLTEPGDMVVVDTSIRKMTGGRFTARGLDDRLGVFIIMEALKRARERGCKKGVYCSATVGEETTKNGAYWSAARIEPQLAIVVDVTYTTDCLGMKEADAGRILLGGGPALCDSPIVPKELNVKLRACARAANIPVQLEVAGGMTHTDADKIHFCGPGIPTLLVSIPLRYMHSPAEVADEKDVENCIQLLTEFLMDE